MKLELPWLHHKKSYENLIKEWSKIENLENISPWVLFCWNNFNEFLEKTEELRLSDVDWFTQSYLYFLVNENNEIVGWIDIRVNIKNSYLSERWWHIWYWIVPKFRKKWYATKMLEMWLIKAKNLWIHNVLITCSKDNIWSNKVILNNWWVFERETNCWIANRYWIEL